MELTQHLIPIPQIILHSSSTGLIIKHIKHLPKIHWACTIRPSITNQIKHHIIGMVLFFDILIHPDLPKNVNRLNTEPLTNPVSNTRTSSNITTTTHNTSMLNIIPLLK
ncbi:C5 protein [Tomato leaf curl Uganda virus]|nr:C5 protein [Tomato leaf curl Uganda virus]